MRLVLLPGLNGNSRLFAPLLAQLADVSCQVIELPRQGRQDHDALAFTLKEQLGATPFVLLGESFSGALAHRLALQCPEGLAGLVFAASFLQRPHPLLTTWSSRLPVPKALLAQSGLLRLFCLCTAFDLGAATNRNSRSVSRTAECAPQSPGRTASTDATRFGSRTAPMADPGPSGDEHCGCQPCEGLRQPP